MQLFSNRFYVRHVCIPFVQVYFIVIIYKNSNNKYRKRAKLMIKLSEISIK